MTAVQVGRIRVARPALPGWLSGVIAFIGIIILWQVLTATLAPGSRFWPTPWRIITVMHKDGWTFYWENIRTTLWEATRGFVWGNLIAIVLAVIAVTIPVLERPLTQLGVVSYCLPIVALASIFTVVFNGQTPKVIISALFVFFTTFVGTVLGLRSASKTSLDVVRAYGGGTWSQLVKVRSRACLPSLFAALRIAGGSAVLGAMLGEYLGANSGLGIVMVNSETQLNLARTWGLALTATTMGGIVFVIVGIVGRLTTSWSRPAAR